MTHKHVFEKDKTFTKSYCYQHIKPKYPGFYWQSERFVCKHCGKVKYEKTDEVNSYHFSDQEWGLLR